jgi:predicted Zn-dependent peptidase
MSVQVTELKNGLKVASDLMPGVDTVSLGVWVNVGTRDEQAEVNGIAHLLEHMAFKGTKRRSARQIAEAIEEVGGHLNAYTTREQTAYYAKVLAEDAPLAVDIVTDILQHATFEEDELKRERAVVLQEIGQAIDTPDDIIFDHFQATAYPDQPLGRPVLGRAEIVENLTRNDLLAYATNHYGSRNMVAVAAGRIDHARFVADIEAAFEGLKSAGRSTDGKASYRGGDFREARELEQVHVVLGFPSVDQRHPAYYAHAVYATLLGGGMSSRLFQEVREKRGLVYSIYSYASPYRDGGLFSIYAGTGTDELDELLPVVAAELKSTADKIGADELQRAKAQMRAGTLMARESSASRAESLAQQLLVYGRPMPVPEILERLEAVTVEDVRAVAAELLRHPPTVATLGPAGARDVFELFRRNLD